MFARAVLGAGLAWVGPSPEVLEITGDKVAARKAFRESGFPVLPGDGPFLEADQAVVASTEIGYPVMVKAVLGGGGIGMGMAREEAGCDPRSSGPPLAASASSPMPRCTSSATWKGPGTCRSRSLPRPPDDPPPRAGVLGPAAPSEGHRGDVPGRGPADTPGPRSSGGLELGETKKVERPWRKHGVLPV
jgi:Carbamoyl-phosphate synthase L chain, ATP binding domain